MKLAHVTLATRDLRRSLAFFSEALGWRVLDRAASAPAPVAWLQVGPGQEVHLIELADFEPSSFEREYGRHIAFSCPAAEIAGLRARLQAHGVEPVSPAREPNASRFFFRDANGYLFEVVPGDPD